MKMKEKKTEEVVEEVVETPKISNELKEYLEFARQCEYQIHWFNAHQMFTPEQMDGLLNNLGVDVLKPVSIITYIPEGEKLEKFEAFIQEWVIVYNSLDLSKLSNYEQQILSFFAPNPFTINYIRKQLKKCAQHTTEE